MEIERLFEILKPPTAPLERPTPADWGNAERSLGELPGDYKAFIDVYGTGTIDQFLWVYSPSAQSHYLNITVQIASVLGSLKITADKYPEEFPMARFPEKGGFMPCAITDNGDSVFWVANGHASEWTIAVMGPRAPDVFRYPGGLVAFLHGVLSKQVICSRFPSDFPSDAPLTFAATRK